MKDEIKEILIEMCHIIWKYGDDFDDLEENEIRYQLPYKQMEKLYDYITNLQEENERLNNQYDLMENSLDRKQYVIDKAIEYIEKHSNNCMFELRMEEMEDLLNILKGDDKE